MFSVMLKRWMKSYALRNASPIIASYTHPILHLLAYVAILRETATAQNESHRCVCMCARVIMLCVCVCVCVCVHAHAWVQCFYDSCCIQEHKDTPYVWMYNLILEMWTKFYALKNTAHVIAILHIFAICGNSQGSKWPKWNFGPGACQVLVQSIISVPAHSVCTPH
jgi:hypothetical protein